jgi:hypothetical protein
MIHLTPEMLVLSYALLKETPPFKGWRMPHPEDVGFSVSRTLTVCGQFWVDGKGTPCIAVSTAAVSRLDTLVRIMAHEMIHLQQTWEGTATNAMHNADFKRKARSVCRYHGFDPKLFV